MSKAKQILTQIDEEFLFEMATTIYGKYSGMPFNVWVSEAKYASGKHHRPRLKVEGKRYKASIAIDNPIVVLGSKGKMPMREFNIISAYINLNRGLLMQLWDEHIDADQYKERQQYVRLI